MMEKEDTSMPAIQGQSQVVFRGTEADAAAQNEKQSSDSSRIGYLRGALVLVGVIFIAGIYPLTVVWPSGWSWHTGHSDYLQMILGVYATLGVFLLLASRNPLEHLSLIRFTVWSSIVHAGIMAVQSVVNPMNMAHLWGDVLALFVVAGLLAFLAPRGRVRKPNVHRS
jgi:uncharacterized protein DUF6632